MRLISHQISFHCEEIRNTIFAEEIVYLGIFLFSLDQKSRFKERKYQPRRFFLANISVNEARFARRNYQPTAFLLRYIFVAQKKKLPIYGFLIPNYFSSCSTISRASKRENTNLGDFL